MGGGQNLFYFYVAQHGRRTCNNVNQINSLKIPQPIIMAFFTGQLLLLLRNTVQGSV